ncbi:hypothetical protein ILUMI_27083 [Ignelater luminosus]|uniref:STAS domain-containing protein n=1 Tax=Ignelater luminosus TaxID=2038154 RepID=A0A8K0FYH8_IGNLU|nr:hypothetical protein ILUMI_27083 [Ignelater luminosus]
MNLDIEPNGKKSRLKNLLYKRFYILQWIPEYTKFDGISDVIAGITVGLTMMPQSMAYASLANLPAHYGLYSSFMGAFIYIFFGTIKEVSIGPTSLMALLTLSYTDNLSLDFVILLCFLCGWVELLMGIFKLGFIVDFISAPAISGFTSATSVIIILAQLKGLFGIKFKSNNIFHYVQQFVSHSSDIKINDLILGIGCIVFLLIFRKFKDVKPKSVALKKTFWLLSIGRNALTVLFGSLIAFYFESKTGKSPFTLSGAVHAGIPTFKLPNFNTKLGNETISFMEMVHELGTGIIVLPVVAVLANVAIAKAFASGRVVDATQEMITLGLCNIFGSFVQSMPTCGAFTRSAVANASGIRTPMAGIYAGTIILLALTFLTPYFYYVPKSTLSAVLISAVIFMIDYEIIPKLWKSNRFDLLITILTFVISLMYGVEQGLLVGVLINFIPLLKLWTRPKVEFSHSSNKKGNEYLMIKPELGLYYSAVDYLTQEIVKITATMNSAIPIVIDCSNILQVDYTATQALNGLVKMFKKKNQEVLLYNLTNTVFDNLKEVINTHEMHCCKTEEEISSVLTELKIKKSDDIEAALIPYKE